ncbi:hypothetical protein EVAR_65569_1 [Eumeta japonica]|uniref:Uncharacterized protein n=1 Tax=Eumeta variegata TaxID=151549 RepID=A0A4C1ZBV6_EUMVA|nr:hypothetical protein EVAR_65569_1 [Eumeta japonica]
MDICPKTVISEYAVSSAWVTTALQPVLATKTDVPPACHKSAGHTANCLVQTAPRRAPARAITANLSYAKATVGPRKDPSTNSAPNNTSTENIKALRSMISIIDFGKIAFLAKKAAASPVEKILLLVEHAALVEAIKNNKI